MTRISQAELVSNVAESTGTPTSTVKAAISTFIDQVQMNVKQGKTVNLHGFITLGTRKRKKFKSRNPRTGESIQVPASTVVSVKVSNSFKSIVDARKRTAMAKKAAKAPAKKAPAKKVVAKKAPAKKVVAKKAPAKKVVAKKSPAKKPAKRASK